MALHFSANQYEKEFHPKRLQNWEVPKVHRAPINPKLKHLPDVDAERPRSQEGFTQIIATDRGHLKSGIPRSLENPWGNFVGTWDQTSRFLGNNVSNPTARAGKAINKFERQVQDGDDALQVKTPVNHKIDLSKKASESPIGGAERDVGSGRRSGARTPELGGIPLPPPEAIYTPTMEQITARQIENKATSMTPIDHYPSPRFTTPPPKDDGFGGSVFPDHHHFIGYDHKVNCAN